MPDCRRVVVGHCLGRGAAESELANQYPVTLKQPIEFDGDGASDPSQVAKERPDQTRPGGSQNLNFIAVREKGVECMNG